MFLNNSNKTIFESNQKITKLEDIHLSYFLLRWDSLTEDAKKDFESYIQTNTDIVKVGEEETYESSVRFTATTRDTVTVKKIYVKYPSLVLTVSDDLFMRYKNYGGECYQFDIPYRSLVLLENCASNIPEKYLFNTDNKDEILKILSYDIETLNDGTICIIGYSSFNVTINSYFDIVKEESRFDIINMPEWQDVEVKQLVAEPNDEHKLLYVFAKLIMQHDIVSGHNIIVYDNKEVVDRIKYHIDNNSYNKQHLNVMHHFLKTYTEDTKIFNLGKLEEGTLIFPNSLDTLLAFKRLYFNLPSYTLKNLAKEFGIDIKDRVYFKPTDYNKITKDSYNSDLFKKFVKYNEHDVIEQNGLTLIALPSILAMSFLTCSPLDEAVIKSNTRMGDNIVISRSMFYKRIFSTTVSADKVCKELIKQFSKPFLTYTEIKNMNVENKMLLKIAKYGNEAPLFVYYPALVVCSETTGGLTVHPNDNNGHLPSTDTYLLPFYKIINPDVAALYPNILRAKNSCSDSVRFALKNEDSQDWVWVRNINKCEDNKICERIFYESEIKDECPFHIKEPEYSYQDSGIMLGVIINENDGMISKALGGILDLTTKIKQDKKEEKDQDKLRILEGLYKSLKSVRNSFTHGLILAFTVNCRQSNLAAGSLIPSTGNEIMYDVYAELKKLE